MELDNIVSCIKLLDIFCFDVGQELLHTLYSSALAGPNSFFSSPHVSIFFFQIVYQ